MYNIKNLTHEIYQIPDDKVRAWTIKAFENCQPEFYSCPSSFSGKWHPKDEHGDGGCLIHTKRCFYVLSIFLDSETNNFTDEEKSMMMSAILMHDICRIDGPLHAETVEPYFRKKLGDAYVDQYPLIMNMIRKHMGRWGKEAPNTLMERLVHYADNIASKAHNILPAGKV